MELHFQQQLSSHKKTKNKNSSKRRFVGVRQRPSGKWVAEIKNTTQKIRIWLGTFESAEEAAMAYDEAACLLRGSNTRTNFLNTPSSSSINTTNSALSLRIRNLVNQKKNSINTKCQSPTPTPTPTPPSATLGSASATPPSTPPTQFDAATNTNLLLNQPSNTSSIGTEMLNKSPYRPQLDVSGQFDYLWAFPQHPRTDPISNNLGTSPKQACLMPDSDSEVNNESSIPEFERMKVERQISASLYAMNGVIDYFQNVFNVHNSNDIPSWDLLYQPFYLG